MSGNLCMGPVLLFRGLDDASLRLCALTMTEGPDSPGDLTTATGGSFAPERLLENDGRVLWRTPFSVPAEQGEAVSYRIAGHAYTVAVPPPEGARLLFVACNGAEEPSALPDDPKRYCLWRAIAEAHRRQPFHLLLQGGDQVYADQVWNSHPLLAPFKDRRAKAVTAEFDAAMARAVRRFYFDLYQDTWTNPDIAPALATIPSVMMWDDHDIIDGWGSWSPSLQRCPVYRGLFSAARQAFAAFQLGVKLNEPLPDAFLDPSAGHFSWLYRMGDIAIWAPDLRSGRSQTGVLGERGWRDVATALERARGCRHLFVVSSVPLLNAPMRWLERLHFAVPGHQYFQDDLRDQWQSYAHAAEWERFVDALLRFKAETGSKITVLSGEIHLGAWALLEAAEGHIHQLISSGVVHPPPPSPAVWLMEWKGRREWRLGRRARFRLHPMPGLGRRYLAERNWLALEPASAERTYQALWRTEQGNGEPLLLD